MQTDFSGYTGLEDALKRVKNTVHEALIYQDLPINLLEQKLRLAPENYHQPLFRITLNLLDDAKEMPDAGGLKLASIL